ncbi:MAG: hypothetical protein KF752_07365 [Pirellulaceae bacterium]|nr:hypothetical protein [Pirellulaceae bacterium]
MICLTTTQAVCQEMLLVELRNGMQLGPGTVEPTDTVSTDSMQKGTSGEVISKPIDVLNDGLRRTYYNASPRNVINSQVVAPDQSTKIDFAAASEANRTSGIQSFRAIEQISKFNRNGRRTLTCRLADGNTMVALQQITQLTPQYAKLEILRGSDQRLAWESREAISSIPAEELQLVLENALDLTRSSEWLRMYAFYLEAKRYRDARRTIEEAIKRFPAELGGRAQLIAQTEQLLATQQFDEISVRRQAGQTQMAYSLLSAFPRELIETQLKVKNELEQLSRTLVTIRSVTQSLRERLDRLPAPDQEIAGPLVEELLEEISIESAVRLDDYIRLGGDDSLANENLVAMAIGGWILGPGSGIQNFAVAKSLIRVRGLVGDYLREPDASRREAILGQIRSQEGAEPQLLARMLEHMKPPLDLAEHQPSDAEGFYRQSVTVGRQPTEYTIQLPPEYDPLRKYPCVVALPGSLNEYRLSIPIDYWCGQTMALEESQARFGQATRHGFIIICPKWMSDSQAAYAYTEVEKARVLACYRDALRRCSINTDRAFIAGHFEGATAAWDIAQSHPDLWAGAVLISPTADKYILQYHQNIQSSKDAAELPLATYVVYGQMDGVRLNTPAIGTALDRYLKSFNYDCMVVEYIGQGRGLFSAELPRIMQWMQLSSRQRQRTPRTINCVSLRPGDRFFYWLEAPQLAPENSSNAIEYEPSRDAARKGAFEATLLGPGQNGVRVQKIPSADRSAWVWLTPQMVDFGREIQVVFRSKSSKVTLSPDISVMLEDVRQRGDRQHVFWQRLKLGGKG